MEKIRISTKGQVIIPKWVRAARGLKAGDELMIFDTAQGILLKPIQPFPVTTLDEVYGCLPYAGKALTLEEMEEGIARGVQEHR